MRSLLRQGAAKLRHFTRRPGIREIRERALRDADIAVQGGTAWKRVAPMKVMVEIEGFQSTAPAAAVRTSVPKR
jgi:hypothetical protein